MDQTDAAPKKLILDSSDVLFESVLSQQRVPMPAEIPHPERQSRFGLDRSQPVDARKLWSTNPANDAPKLAIEVSPGLHLGLTFDTGATAKSDPHQTILGEQTRSKSTLFGGAGIFLQHRF